MIKTNKIKNLKKGDAYLIVSDINRNYFSSYKTSYGYLVVFEDRDYYLTDFRYSEEATEHFKDKSIEVIGGISKDIDKTLAQLMLSHNVKTLGLEEDKISHSQYVAFQKLFPSIEFVNISEDLESFRVIKDTAEIEFISKAQQITDKTFNKIINIIKPGITERDLCIELNYQLHLNGAEGLAFDTIIASGNNSSRPHSSVSNKKIANGEFIIMDFGAKFKGYCSDMTRTIAVGKVSEEMENVYETVLKSQQIALNALKLHPSCSELYKVTNEFFIANGYEKEFLHSLGHGVGLEIHEKPSINAFSQSKLLPNMVITVEPGIYIANSFGVRIEDLIIIKEDGIKNLTASNKQMIVV